MLGRTEAVTNERLGELWNLATGRDYAEAGPRERRFARMVEADTILACAEVLERAAANLPEGAPIDAVVAPGTKGLWWQRAADFLRSTV